MSVALQRSQEEIQDMPLVELAYEILKAKGEPLYFRELMREVQALRGMSEEEAMEVIARLYTEINIDGRFVCIGQNVWGLKRWYPVDKVAERTLGGKRFIRGSGDAFSDEDEDLELDEYDEDLVDDEESDEVALYGDEETGLSDVDEDQDEFAVPPDEEESDLTSDDELPLDEPLLDEDVEDDSGEHHD